MSNKLIDYFMEGKAPFYKDHAIELVLIEKRQFSIRVIIRHDVCTLGDYSDVVVDTNLPLDELLVRFKVDHPSIPVYLKQD